MQAAQLQGICEDALILMPESLLDQSLLDVQCLPCALRLQRPHILQDSTDSARLEECN